MEPVSRHGSVVGATVAVMLQKPSVPGFDGEWEGVPGFAADRLMGLGAG